MSAYSDAVLALTPAAYWRMGEASGDLADSSGNGNTATAAGAGLVYGIKGAIANDGNTAVTLPDLATDYFEAANSASLDVADTLSVIGWFKKAENDTYMSLVTRPLNGYAVRMSNINQLQLEKTGVATIVNSTVAITDTLWHSFGAVKLGAAVKLYLDGADVTGTVTNQTIVANGGVTRIGGNPADTTNGPWDGSLDEIAVFAAVLTAGQIRNLHLLGSEDADDRRRRR